MKVHWGMGLAAGIVLFVLLVAALAAIAMSNRVDLVTEHYYDRGIAYQERINSLRRTAAREEKPLISILPEEVIIEFPRRSHDATLGGTITIYRPADKSLDVVLRVTPDSAGVQHIVTHSLDRGLWKLQIAWREGDQDYYAEQPVMIL
jgi:nitrogen fixation protein FixH